MVHCAVHTATRVAGCLLDVCSVAGLSAAMLDICSAVCVLCCWVHVIVSVSSHIGCWTQARSPRALCPVLEMLGVLLPCGMSFVSSVSAPCVFEKMRAQKNRIAMAQTQYY